jgi:hypothetical protein
VVCARHPVYKGSINRRIAIQASPPWVRGMHDAIPKIKQKKKKKALSSKPHTAKKKKLKIHVR